MEPGSSCRLGLSAKLQCALQTVTSVVVADCKPHGHALLWRWKRVAEKAICQALRLLDNDVDQATSTRSQNAT